MVMQCTNLGGMEQVAYALMRDLASTGRFRFRVTTPRPFGPGESRVRALDPHAQAFPYRGRFGWRDFSSFRKHLQTRAAEASTAWVMGTCAASLAALKRLPRRKQKILSHHYHHFESRTSGAKWWGFYHALCRQLDLITYPTDFTRREALRLAPWLAPKAHVVRNGYTSFYTGETERLRLQAEARQQLGLDPEAFLVGNAGWLIPRKRFDLFLHTCALLKAKLPRAQFVVCGGGHLEDELKALAHSLNIADSTHFFGWVEDLTPHYRAWDLCLFNSDFDTLPCTPMEAASHGCVVAASLTYGGLGEFLEDGATGLFASEHDPALMAQRICELARNPAFAENLRAAAAEKLDSEFSTAQALAFYEDAIR